MENRKSSTLLLKGKTRTPGASMLAILPWLKFPAETVGAPGWIECRIHGRVTDSRGLPVPGAQIRINLSRGDRSRFSRLTSKADASGRYELVGSAMDSSPLTVTEMFADAPGFARRAHLLELKFPQCGNVKLDFVLQPGGIIFGVIRPANAPAGLVTPIRPGDTTADRFLEAFLPGDSTRDLNARSVRVGAGGEFQLWLRPGVYSLRLHHGPLICGEWTGIRTGGGGLELNLPVQDWSSRTLSRDFERFWAMMDRHYSFFRMKPSVDWPALHRKFLPRVALCRNASQLVEVLIDMLKPLADSHVWIEAPGGPFPTSTPKREFNGNFAWMHARLRDRLQCGPFALVGRVRQHGFGCLVLLRQTDATADNVRQALNSMNRFQHAPGFILDLRSANGGDEELMLPIAEWFAHAPVVYAGSVVRNGPGHGDFSEPRLRSLHGRSGVFRGPVVCLTGPCTVSSGEGFAQMLRVLPNVSLIGLPTGGSSGNPLPWSIGHTGVNVHFSRWVDLLPEGSTIETTGIRPAISVKAVPGEYAKRDVTFQTAVEFLQAKAGLV